MNKIIIIGGGSIGKRHLRNLLSLGEKNCVMVEVGQERAEEIRKEFNIEVFLSLDQAWEKNQYNIAFVCSPSRFHIEQSLFCAQKGADLFIEKPVSHNLKNVEKLSKIVERYHLITMVGSNWKFYPLFVKMKGLLEAGAIGRVLSARCQFGQYLPDWHPWEDYRKGYSANQKLGGGILLDSHEFDYLTWFLGKAKRLSCFAKKVSNLEIDVEDLATIMLEFETGAIGEIHLDYLQRFYQRNFEFFGETGTIIWDTNKKEVIMKTKDSGEQSWPLATDYDINDMYVEEVKHFIECVARKQETITPLKNGIGVLKLIMAAKKSSTKNKVISL